MIEHTEYKLAPMRIGEILDHGFDVLLKLLKPLALLGLIVALLTYLPGYLIQSSPGQVGVILMTLPVTFLSWLLYFYFYLLIILAGAPAWVGKPVNIKQARSHISLSLMFRVFGLLLWISFVAFLIPMAVFGLSMIVLAMNAALAVFMFVLGFIIILPALVYWLNRIVAVFVYVFEIQTMRDAISKSRHLMSFQPHLAWYSFQTPKMRVSGILLITFVLSTLPQVFAVGVISWDGDITGAVTSLSAISVQLLAQLLSVLATAFSTLVMLGFYYDLRIRVEGLDLEERIGELESRAVVNKGP